MGAQISDTIIEKNTKADSIFGGSFIFLHLAIYNNPMSEIR